MARSREYKWEHFDETARFHGLIYGANTARMAVVGLGAGELLVVSPGRSVRDGRFEEMAAWGKPRFLLAPNHFHWAGIRQWKERFPEVTVVAHPTAFRRLRKKMPEIEIQDLSALTAALPQGVRVFGPAMAKQGETWISVKTGQGTAWFVTDALINEEELPGGALGLLMRALGFRTGLINNPFFRRFFLKGRSEYREWLLAELDRDKPVLFVPSHGTVLRGAEVHAQLRAVVEKL
ncbi:MAG: hypothetical protein R3B70_14135 [Polyangiaceae bacterium]